MKRVIPLIALLTLFTSANAQLKTYLSLEAGPQWSLIKVTDPGNQFKNANVRSSIAGFTIAQEIIPNLFLSTGIYYLPQKEGINMIDDRPHQANWASYESLKIPIRAEYRIQPAEYPFSFTPRIGYMRNLKSTAGPSYSASSILSAPDGTVFTYNLDRVLDEAADNLMEVGIGVDVRFSGVWQASFNLSYLTGLFNTPVTTMLLDYTDPQGNTQSAEYSSKGNSIYTTLAFKIPVSNIWQNRDYRIRARIEKSVYIGKPTDKKGQFYVGAELGSLWRLFDASNPAIGARPMDERGVFRYANMHMGGYVGYMLSNELGIDAGINYQRSNSMYSLMYDHEVDFVIKTPAPLYLELPLRIRYFYNVYKERIYAVVYGGASLLTHFSSGNYNQGSAPFSYHSPAAGGPVDATTSYLSERITRVVPVLRLGTGVEYALPMEFPLIATLYVNYMNGFMSVEQTLVSNTLPETPAQSSVAYKGSGWSLDVGVKIPFRFSEKGNCAKPPKRE